ncbi:MAG: hypothetical protein E3K37_02480 [Candidatus Kuenenia sp.]|nr:hypothetical protein [Candidatus Kuenenia hertensis]
MNKKNENNQEECLRQLTEDVSHYLWALSEWFEPTKDHSDTYLFLEIIERRSSAKKLISGLNRVKRDKDEYIKKLEHMMEKGETGYKKFLLQTDRIEDIVENSIPEILNYLKSTLGEITRLYNESLICEEDPLEEELYDLEMDFICSFTRLYHVKETVHDIKVSAESFCSELTNIEADFKKRFYCFEPVTDFFSYQKETLRPCDKEWWYLTKPDCYRKHLFAYIEGDLVPEKRQAMEQHLAGCAECDKELKKIEKSYEMTGKIASLYAQPVSDENCPKPEDLSAYALDKSALTTPMVNSINEHVSTCIYCLDDVVSLRAAAATPREIKFAEIPLAAKARYKMRKFLTKVKGFAQFPKLSDLLPEYIGIAPQMGIVFSQPMSGSSSKIVDIDTMHHLKVHVDNENKITLLPNPGTEELPEDKLNLCKAFERGKFYYKVFIFYMEGTKEKIKEINSGTDEYLPFRIDQQDTNFFIVCLSKDENNLIGQTEKLLNAVNNESKVEISNIVCLFVDIQEK